MIVSTQRCLFESFPKLALDNSLRQAGPGPKCLSPTSFKSPPMVDFCLAVET